MPVIGGSGWHSSEERREESVALGSDQPYYCKGNRSGKLAELGAVKIRDRNLTGPCSI